MNETSASPLAPEPRNASAATWSLVLGILGLVGFGLFTGIPALICGHRAQSKIRRSAGALKGEGLALWGLITGYICIAFSVLVTPLPLAIAIPNFVKARETAQRNACINNLRQLDGAKQQWALEYSKPDDAVPTFTEVTSYLKSWTNHIVCPAGGVYTLGAVNERTTCSVPGHELEGWRPHDRLPEERVR